MSTLVMCGACGAAVPSGAFCAVCGSALTVPDSPPSPVAATEMIRPPGALGITPSPKNASPEYLSPTQHGEASTTTLLPGPAPVAAGGRMARGRWNAKTAGGLLAATVVIVAAVIIFGHGAKHTLTGELTLTDSSLAGDTTGASCEGSGGYDDISAGAEVRVKDESGTLISTSQLDSGSFDGESCVFPFTVADVSRAKFYEISAGNQVRGGVHYTPDDLKSQHWAVHLVLGP